jgi:hypothetical protein
MSFKHLRSTIASCKKYASLIFLKVMKRVPKTCACYKISSVIHLLLLVLPPFDESICASHLHVLNVYALDMYEIFLGELVNIDIFHFFPAQIFLWYAVL